MSEKEMHEDLRNANANRAVLYYLIYDEMRKVTGQEEAIKVMKKAIYRRGVEMSEAIKQYAPSDLQALGQFHLTHSAGGGALFNPEIQRHDTDAFEVLNTTCPLKQAWIDYGLSDEDVALMCDIGSAIDYGKFEGAGFKFECDTWKPGKRGCCTLKAYSNENS
ncbi:MAG: hypothetical protein CL877_08685 [Dehalococcoidales bacterium]|jgi:hypothetical protein|nr:hypothetical protein [Dehalococcoidales bacterium]